MNTCYRTTTHSFFSPRIFNKIESWGLLLPGIAAQLPLEKQEKIPIDPAAMYTFNDVVVCDSKWLNWRVLNGLRWPWRWSGRHSGLSDSPFLIYQLFSTSSSLTWTLSPQQQQQQQQQQQLLGDIDLRLQVKKWPHHLARCCRFEKPRIILHIVLNHIFYSLFLVIKRNCFLEASLKKDNNMVTFNLKCSYRCFRK